MTESRPIDNDGTEGLTVSAAGVDVRVLRRVADGGVPAFEYVITSNRSEHVDVLVSQSIPAAVDADAIGVPTSPEDTWTVRDDEWMTYGCRLQPGATVRTAWGAKLDFHPALEPPTVHVDASPDATAAPASGELEGDAANPSAATSGADGPTDGTPAPVESREAASDAGAVEESPTAEADETTSADVESADDSELTGDSEFADDAEPTDDGATRSDSAHDSVTAAIVHELRTGSVPERDREALRRALGLQQSASPDELVERVQELHVHHNQVAEAIEALEERIDGVRGSTPTTTEINQLKRALTQLYDASVDPEQLATVRQRVEEIDEASADVEVIRDLKGALEQLEHDAATAAELAEVRERVAALEETAATVDQLEAVRAELDDVATGLDELEAAAASDADLASAEADLADVAAVQASLRESVEELEALEATVADLDADRIDADVADLEERVRTLTERAASADALTSVNERLKQVEQGVLGYETIQRRLTELEADTRERLDRHDATLAKIEAAATDTGDGVRQAVNETRSDVARIETRIDEEALSDDEVADAVASEVRSNLPAAGLLAAGAGGLIAAVPLALAFPLAAVAAGVAGATSLVGGWRWLGATPSSR